MAPNHNNLVITNQASICRFNPKPEIHRSKLVEEKTTGVSHKTNFEQPAASFKSTLARRPSNPELSNAVLNPSSGQCVLFKPNAQNVSKLVNDKYVPSHLTFQSNVRANISQVLNSPSLNEKQKVALSNLMATTSPRNNQTSQQPEMPPQH